MSEHKPERKADSPLAKVIVSMSGASASDHERFENLFARLAGVVLHDLEVCFAVVLTVEATQFTT